MGLEMIKKDTLQRFIFENAPIRGEIVHLHKSFDTIIHQHAYPPPIQRLLGEALSVAALLCAIIKFDGRLTVQFRGKGKLKMLLAQCNEKFHLRGLAKWEGESTYEDLMDAFNQGILTIMLDSGVSQSRYQGIVSWRGNSLVESIEGYFRDSEQLATKIWLAVSDKMAAGFLLQVIPTAEKEPMGVANEIVAPHWEHILKLTMEGMIPQKLLLDDERALLTTLYPEEEIRLFEPVKLKFKCTCSRASSANAISLLGREEAEEECRDKKSLVVTCDFCNKEYVFDSVDVAKIFSGKDSHPTDKHIH